MEIIIKNINEIKPYENNAKLHPKNQIEQIKNSITTFGNCDPIAIDENNVIIEGHGRYMALSELGYKEIECIIISGLNEEEKNAYRLVHNQLTMNSGWDMEKLKEELKNISLDMLELGITEEMFSELDKMKKVEDDEFDLDSALDEIEEPVSKLGYIYQLGNHRLMCGDSTDKKCVEKLMNNKKTDLVVTDPPYNVNYEGTVGSIKNDNMNDIEFKEFLVKAFNNMCESMKNGCAFYIWYASREHINFENALKESGLEPRQQLIWVKNSLVLSRQDYHWQHEPCLYGWKEGAAHNWYSDRAQTTILNFDKPKKNDLHPTMKPLDLIGYLIRNSSKSNDIVLDLFGGSGSTLIACEQLNRKCYMMEYDPKYVDVIVKRWELLTGKKAELIENE